LGFQVIYFDLYLSLTQGLHFAEGVETGCGLPSIDDGGVTGVAGSLGCSSCKEIKKQEQWLPKIVPKCLRKHTK